MNRRIIVIDDNHDIHNDYRRILEKDSSTEIDLLVADFFGDEQEAEDKDEFQLDSAFQGEEGRDMIAAAKERGEPYALAFVDMRMPPGWDGLKTIEEIWKVDPNVQCAICTAYSDYAWSEIVSRLGRTDKILFLKKPFDCAEIEQIAIAMTEKWTDGRGERAINWKITELRDLVEENLSGTNKQTALELCDEIEKLCRRET